MNILEIIRGHEGEIFYSPVFGPCEFVEIHDRDGGRPSIKVRLKTGNCRNLTPTGRLGYELEGLGECILWPSKECRDWSEYVATHHKEPIWEELIKEDSLLAGEIVIDESGGFECSANLPFELVKSSVAFYMIRLLIGRYFGGNVDYLHPTAKSIILVKNTRKPIIVPSSSDSLIIFKDQEQAEKFLQYPENLQLLKDLYGG